MGYDQRGKDVGLAMTATSVTATEINQYKIGRLLNTLHTISRMIATDTDLIPRSGTYSSGIDSTRATAEPPNEHVSAADNPSVIHAYVLDPYVTTDVNHG